MPLFTVKIMRFICRKIWGFFKWRCGLYFEVRSLLNSDLVHQSPQCNFIFTFSLMITCRLARGPGIAVGQKCACVYFASLCACVSGNNF